MDKGGGVFAYGVMFSEIFLAGQITAELQFVREDEAIVKVFALFDKAAFTTAVDPLGASNGPVESPLSLVS